MVISEQRLRELEEAQEALTERLDGLAGRVGSAAAVAARHGDEHTDLGLDPIMAGLVAGHTHAGGDVPVIEATTSSSEPSNTTSHTVSLPSGIVDNNLLVVGFALDWGAVTWPTGWTLVFSQSRGLSIKLEVAVYEADGAEGASITVTTAESQASAHAAYRISGARVGSTAISAEGSDGVTTSDGPPDPDSLTPTGGSRNFLWLACAGVRDGAITSAPTSYSNLIAIDTAEWAGIGMADRGFFASSEDPGPFTQSFSGATVAGTIAIYPDEGTLHSGAPDAHHTESHTLTSHSTKSFALATEGLAFVDAGSASATEQDWLEVTVGGNTGYIRVFAAK